MCSEEAVDSLPWTIEQMTSVLDLSKDTHERAIILKGFVDDKI